MSAQPLLRLEHLTKDFGGLRAVNDVTLHVTDEHDFWGLVGPNGSGKSTLFNLMTGVHAPTSGNVWTPSEAAQTSGPALGRTFQHPRVFERLTIAENLLAVVPHLPIEVARERVERLLGLVELAHLAHRLAGELSIGQQKLVELARALMNEPDLVLLDEMAAGIHPRLVAKLADHLRRLADTGTTFLLIEHNMGLVMELCSHIFVLSSGSLIASGTPAEVQSDPHVIDTYLGVRHA